MNNTKRENEQQYMLREKMIKDVLNTLLFNTKYINIPSSYIFTPDQYIDDMVEALTRNYDKKRDCNNCVHIDITQSEQNILEKLDKQEIHRCKLYDKELFHLTNTVFIYPCNECMYTSFKDRELTK